MSQSSRHKALRPVREREQVARALVQVCKATGQGQHGYRQPAWDGVGRKPRRQALVESFDVHAAADHGVALVEQAAWDRTFGKASRPTPSDTASRLRLGRLILAAIEGQPSECQRPTCGGRGEIPSMDPGDYQAVGGLMRPKLVACPDCHGTGRNLRGVLPAVEWSAQVRRKVRDSGAQCGPGIDANPQRRDDDGMAAWVGGITDALDDIGMVAPDQPWYTLRRHCGTLDLRTRVEYRGEHRPWVVAVDASLDARITARGLRRGYMTNDAAGDVVGVSRCPGWYRGELKHATQRRDRRARAAERRGAA